MLLKEQIFWASREYPVCGPVCWSVAKSGKDFIFFSPKVCSCGERTYKINEQRKRIERRWTDKHSRTSRRFYPVRIAITALWVVVGLQFTVCIEGEENF